MILNNTNPIIVFTMGFVSTFVFLYVICKLRDKKETQWKQVKKTVSAIDILVLEEVASILKTESQWNKNDDRFCFPGESLSLFCAVAFALQKHLGSYDHEALPMHELRMVIDDMYPERWNDHPLMDFNNHKDTGYNDIQNVITETLKRLNNKINLS